MNPLVPTTDSTLTLLDKETGEYFHNKAGAYTEAVENYVYPSGILDDLRQNNQVVLIDACMGLGYNTWAVIQEALNSDIKVFNLHVVTAEIDPTVIQKQTEVLSQTCFESIPATLPEQYVKKLLLNKQIDIELSSEQRLSISLFSGDLREAVNSWNKQSQPILADYIYHDPFSPNRMPELWTVDLFKSYQTLLNPSGKLLTYSIAGSVRAGLLEAGFTIAKTKAVGDKHGGTIAYHHGGPILNGCTYLTEDEQAYLDTMAGIPYRDSGLNHNRADIVNERQVEQATSGRASGTPLRNKMIAAHQKAANIIP